MEAEEVEVAGAGVEGAQTGAQPRPTTTTPCLLLRPQDQAAVRHQTARTKTATVVFPKIPLLLSLLHLLRRPRTRGTRPLELEVSRGLRLEHRTCHVTLHRLRTWPRGTGG